MKNWCKLGQVNTKLSFGCLGLALLAGCLAPEYTSFAPLDARIEPVPSGGARYFIVVNTSGRELHNVSCSAYMWNDCAPNPIRRASPIYKFEGSLLEWEPGSAMRFRPLDMGIETPIVEHVSRVEIVGHCDEGHFRQRWQDTKSGQLRPVGGGR